MVKIITYEGIDICFTDNGKGRPVVLLHGYLEAKEIWDPLSIILQEKYRVVAIDLPGNGKSGVETDILTMEFMAGAVKCVIDSLGIMDVFMIGHSLGGYVTLAFLELFPEKLSGYSLFHSHPNPDAPAAIENRQREIKVVKAGKKNIMYPGNVTKMFAPGNLAVMNDSIERSKRIASTASARGIIAVLNGMITRPSRKDILEKGDKPLLWILGRNDQYFSPEKGTAGISVPSNAKVMILENSGHLGFVEETELSAQIICDFIEGLN